MEGDYLTPYEVEALVQEIKEIDIKNFGSPQWFKQHETLDRLNIQAHKNAINSTEEYVMESFVTFDKIKSVIYDILMTEAWKQKVFPIILPSLHQTNSLRSYMSIYHEASVCNLLEVLLYNRSACENADDALVELIDYCYRKFLKMQQEFENKPNQEEPHDAKEMMNRTHEEELAKQAKDIEFQTAMCCLSIVRFITDHMEGLPVPIVHQMMENNDIPCILVPLLEIKPWIRKNCKGETEKFEDQRWQVVPPSETHRITKMEAQIWLSIYNMFLCSDANRRYEVTTFRKQNLLRLKKYLTETLLDQLPMLTQMLRALEELSLMADVNVQTKNSFIVQTVPEIREKIMRNKNWNEIAAFQLLNYYNADEESAKKDLNALLKLYSSDAFEEFLEDPKCSQCGKEATQRCSRCKNAWYCSRECQIKSWKAHKKICDLLKKNVEAEQKENEAKQQQKQVQEQPKKKPLIQELN